MTACSRNKLLPAAVLGMCMVITAVPASAQLAVTDPILTAAFNLQSGAIIGELTTSNGLLGSIQGNVLALQTSMETNFQNTNDVIKAASTQVASAVQVQTEALGKVQDAATDTIAEVVRGQAAYAEKAENARTYDSRLGAKAKPSCSILQASVAMKASRETRQGVKQWLDDASLKHNERHKFGEPNELTHLADPRAYLTHRETLAKIDETSPGRLAFFNTAVIRGKAEAGIDEVGAFAQKLYSTANPFPLKLPPSYDDPKQILGEAEKNAPLAVHVDRQQMVDEILNRYTQDRAGTYDSQWVKDLVASSGGDPEKQVIGSDTLSKLEGSINHLGAVEVLSKHRLEDPGWILHTTSQAGAVGLARDANLMQAQQLALMYDIYVEMRYANVIRAMDYALHLEKYGPPKPPK